MGHGRSLKEAGKATIIKDSAKGSPHEAIAQKEKKHIYIFVEEETLRFWHFKDFE